MNINNNRILLYILYMNNKLIYFINRIKAIRDFFIYNYKINRYNKFLFKIRDK